MSSPVPTTAEVPGYPFVSNIPKFLHEQFDTQELDDISHWLWLVGTPKSSHISPLHEQLLAGRNIIITERANLHLLWYRDKVFIKPVPSYLLDTAFCDKNITSELSGPVAGFLRSWIHLLQSPADFQIAREHNLLPVEGDDDKTTIATLISTLRKHRNTKDHDVSKRWNWGQLRLGRLNFYYFIHTLGKREYHELHHTYGSYFGRFMEPFLFVFGTVSVILSAMQVALAAGGTWAPFSAASRWFSVASIITVVAGIVGLVFLFVAKVVREAGYALAKARNNKSKRRRSAGTP